MSRRHHARSTIIRPILLIAAVLCLGSCAGTRYVRTWDLQGVELTDRLYLGAGSFRLERLSADGIIVFSGRVAVHDDEWRFEVLSWKPARGRARTLKPPVVYVCRGHLFANGLAFFSAVLVSGKAPDTFIPIPFDYDREP
jgi:hypothetical protein